MGDTFQDAQWMPETVNGTTFSPFHLKEEVHSFSLAYPRCQHHYCCALEPLLNEDDVNTSTVILNDEA